jgi:hypothetical protein
MFYERAVRSCFENSFNSLNQHLETFIQLKYKSISKQTLEGVTEDDILTMALDPALYMWMEKYFQLKIKLEFNSETKQIQIKPTLDEWIEQLDGLVSYIVEEINYVTCFYASEIGYARESGKIKVFDEQDFFVIESKEKLKQHFIHLYNIPNAYLELVRQYEGIISTDPKKYKKEYKDRKRENAYPIEFYY